MCSQSKKKLISLIDPNYTHSNLIDLMRMRKIGNNSVDWKSFVYKQTNK